MPRFLWTIMMIIIHSLTNNEPVSISAVLFIYSFFTFYITYPSPLAVLCCLYLCYLTKGPKLWMPLPDGTIVAERWAHNLRRSPSLSPAAWNICKKKKKRGRKQLLSLVHGFRLWNSACRLIKLSLTGKTHSTQKINTPSLCVCLCFFSPSVLRVCVFMECLSLLWRKMMRSIILHSLGRHRFLFPCGVPALCKNTDQEFTVSCKKGLYVWRFLSPPSYSHRRNVQVNSGRAFLENSKLSLYLFAPWGWG